MSKIVELAQAVEQEFEDVKNFAEMTYHELQHEKEKTKEFKRRLIELLNDFYPDY